MMRDVRHQTSAEIGALDSWDLQYAGQPLGSPIEHRRATELPLDAAGDDPGAKAGLAGRLCRGPVALLPIDQQSVGFDVPFDFQFPRSARERSVLRTVG